MELYNTCTRLIEKGKTAGMQKKLDIFFANDRLTEEEYTKLCAQLAAKQKVDSVMLKTVSTNRKLSKRADGLYIDPQFERNYAECKRLGIPGVLALALTNQVLSALGKPVLPIESAQLEQIVTTGITTVAALVAWWQNNSFTPEAIKADAEYDRLKMQGK